MNLLFGTKGRLVGSGRSCGLLLPHLADLPSFTLTFDENKML